MEPLTLSRQRVKKSELIAGVGGSFLVHLVVFAAALAAVWTMPRKPIKPPFCTVNLVSLKDLGTGNAEPKGVPKGSEDIRVPEAPKSFAREVQKSGPALPVKRLQLDDEPRRQETPIKKIEPKEVPKLDTPKETAAVNLDKLIAKPKVVPQPPAAVQETTEPAQQASATGASAQPAAARAGKAASTTDSAPRGSPTGSADAGARGATQGSTAGSPEGTSAMNALAGMYGEKVKQAIRREWRLFDDKGITGIKTVVQVQIQKNGEVLNVQVVKTSGNSVFDEAAVRAVRKAAPLPPVPEVMVQSNVITLILNFIPGSIS